MAAPLTTSHPAAVTTAHTEPVSPTGLAALGVDPAILVVQAVNFFLLLAILSWLLYRPLLNLLKTRRTVIAEGLAAAEAQKREAEAAAAVRARLLQEAKSQASLLVTEAREEMKAERAATKTALAAEREQLFAGIDKRLAQERSRLEASLKGELTQLLTTALARILAEAPDDVRALKAKIERIAKDLV